MDVRTIYFFFFLRVLKSSRKKKEIYFLLFVSHVIHVMKTVEMKSYFEYAKPSI